MDGWMDGRTDRRSGWINGWVVGWMNHISPSLPQIFLHDDSYWITRRDILLSSVWLYLKCVLTVTWILFHRVLHFIISNHDSINIDVINILLVILIAFEEAEKNAPAIIFIDELDAIAPKRDKVCNYK